MFTSRDESLRGLAAVAAAESLTLDPRPEGLKALEAWYFEAHARGFAGLPLARVELEVALRRYLGELLVRNAGYTWIVREFAFLPGRYELGVERGLVSVMLGTVGDLTARPNNKRRQSLWREYRRYAD